jgi:hypothetical protein
MSCEPGICDFCKHYEFNGDKDGAYTGDGQCVHVAHPHASQPDEGCEDFECSVCDS